MTNKYKVAYTIEPIGGDGLTVEELKAHPRYSDWGYTDKFLIASILEDDGARSTQIISCDANRQPLSSMELLDVAVLIMRQIAIDGELSEAYVNACWAMFNFCVTARGLPPQGLDHVRKLFADGYDADDDPTAN